MTMNETPTAPRARPAKHPYALQITWRTPLGPMTGRVTARGVRSLGFPPPEALTLDLPAPVGADVKILEIEEIERAGEKKKTPPEGGTPEVDDEVQTRANADQLTKFLIQFFSGLKFERPLLDMEGVGEFDRAVWEATSLIPPGETRSYGQIAATIGRPGAARAVGGALGRNPLVLLVPCHRVIASAPGPRALCGFTGGLALKRTLLELENVKM